MNPAPIQHTFLTHEGHLIRRSNPFLGFKFNINWRLGFQLPPVVNVDEKEVMDQRYPIYHIFQLPNHILGFQFL